MFYKLFRTMKFFYEKTKNNRKEKEWVFKFFYELFNKDEKNKILKFKNMLNAIKNRLEF